MHQVDVTDKMFKKITKWKDEYVVLVFTKVDRNRLDCAQYLHCSHVMSNASLRPSKLAKHRDTRHLAMQSTEIRMLNIKRARYDRKFSLTNVGFVTVENPAHECSYEVTY